MTSADSLSLILRRLDEIERKLDRMMGYVPLPSAIRYAGA
jgi:tetrahydromethanopterin S-methyltransferase subunit G